MTAGEAQFHPPKSMDSRPIAMLLFMSSIFLGLLLPQLPSKWQQIEANAHAVVRAGWTVDWWNGQGCFANPICYNYVFSPLKQTPLAPLLPLGYVNLISLVALGVLAPLILLLFVFFVRKAQDAFRGHEVSLLGIFAGSFLFGAVLSFLGEAFPWFKPLSLYASFLGILLGMRFPGPRILAPYTARYASEAEVRDMILKSPHPYAILLGEKPDGKGVYGVKPGTAGRRELDHVLVVAPTRSGKGLHLQTLAYTWGGSLIIVDIKGEMHRRTSGHRVLKGPVFLLDPTGDGHRFDPFAELETDEEINTAVKMVIDTGDPENRIFEDRASYAFLAMIAASRVRDAQGKPLAPEWTSTLVATLSMLEMSSKRLKDFLEKSPVIAQKAKMGDRWARKALFNIRQFYGDGSDEKFRESSWNILTSTLQAMSTEGVLKMMSGSDFTSKDLVEAPATLYLRFPEGELKATLPVLKLIEASLFAGILRYIDGEKRGWSDNPILWAFDEAGAAPVPELPSIVSTWAGRNMYALVYIQSLSQLETSYQPAGAETILANTLQVFYVGNNNSKTAEYVSQALGKLSQESASYTFSKEASESRSYVARELVTPDEFRQASYPGATPNDIFILPRGRRPILARKLTPFGYIKVPQADPVYPWKEEER